jgi:hypothetical protein
MGDMNHTGVWKHLVRGTAGKAFVPMSSRILSKPKGSLDIEEGKCIQLEAVWLGN